MASFRFLNISGGDEVKTATLTSQSDNNRTTFTMPENYKSGTLKIYYNGVRENGFTETSSTQFQLDFAPLENLPLLVDYTPLS